MSHAADLLLSGPRGRRLCLQYAMSIDPAVRDAVLRLDPSGHGSTILVAGIGDPGARSFARTSPEDVAGALLALGEAPIDADLLRRALLASVDSAAYWQEPDDVDAVTAHPAVLARLHPVAEQVTADVGSDWSEPRTPVQWAVSWNTARPVAVDASAVLEEWAAAQRAAEEEARRERASDPRARWSGTWWSLPIRLLTSQPSVRDALELVEDPAGIEAARVTRLRGEGRTLEIDSPADWIELCRSYPIEVTASRQHDWFRVTGWEGRWLIPHWQRVADEWDSVHLTTLGYLSSATRLLSLDGGYGSVIAGWAPNSTLWLTDTTLDAEPERWRRPDDIGGWVRTSP